MKIRQFQIQKEQNIACQVKQNPKKCWAYINSRLKSKPSIPDLVKKINLWGGEIELTNTNCDKTEVLPEFFASVFTLEPEGEIPKLKDKIICETLMDLDISITDVYKKTK